MDDNCPVALLVAVAMTVTMVDHARHTEDLAMATTAGVPARYTKKNLVKMVVVGG